MNINNKHCETSDVQTLTPAILDGRQKVRPDTGFLLESGSNTPNVVFATLNHPFWVEDVLVDGDYWLAAECLAPGHSLQLASGRKAHVQAAARLYHTQHAQYGFAADARSEIGILVDLSERQLRLADASVAQMLGRLVPREPVCVPVYNFEVEEFHTYYVGDAGVWVHNMDCGPGESIATASEVTELKETCFSGDTAVLMENGTYVDIERVLVGDRVLSRCELTGEMAYKKVIKKFHHAHVTRPGDPYGYEIPAYFVMYSTTNPKWGGGERGGVLYAKAEQMVRLANSYRAPVAAEGIEVGDVFFTDDNKRVMAVQVETANGISYIHWTSGWGGLHVTPEHPIWVEGKGWTAVRDIRRGDQFLTYDGATAIVRQVDTEHETYNVYNLHVEDFHTYFVDSGIWVHNQKITELKSIDKLPAVDAEAKPIENPREP